MTREPLLRVESLKKHYPVNEGLLIRRTVGFVRAVDGVSFTIKEGETLGLVGESGCGKTTTMKVILRLERPTEGRILFDGADVHSLRGRQLRGFRTAVQAVFQDPWGSLSPRMKVREIVGETLIVNRTISRKDLHDRVAQALVQVGLRPEHADLYPHEFSGGQRQRIAVASALIADPKLIVLDEPVSALDVSIRAQVLNLLKKLQDDLGLSYLLVAHDLATVRYLSDHTAVMYLGEIVEYAPTELLFSAPKHPYTKALFAASLRSHPRAKREDIVLSGEVPSPINPPAGCRFHTRCPFVMDRCAVEAPLAHEVGPGHIVACHLHSNGVATA